MKTIVLIVVALLVGCGGEENYYTDDECVTCKEYYDPILQTYTTTCREAEGFCYL